MTEQELTDRLARCIQPGMTARACAKAVEQVLRQAATEDGQKPDIEVFSRGPADHHYASNCWVACWEAGPYQWGIPASFVLMDAGNRLVEPHYSFDVCFYDNE